MSSANSQFLTDDVSKWQNQNQNQVAESGSYVCLVRKHAKFRFKWVEKAAEAEFMGEVS